MALKDLMKNISGVFSRMSADITRRPDGGTSHYRPLRKKAAEPQVGETMMGQPQDPRYVHTGFTGMNPPSYYGGYEQQPAYDQTAFGQTAYGQPSNNTAFQPSGWDQQAGGQTNYFRTQEQPEQQDYVGKGSFSSQPRRNSNISYMPGVDPRPDRGQLHVEHIITLTGLKSCYEAIECMKDGETLIVMLDAIANESESMRCQDMLAGAAFTLGCSVRLLQGARIVVIAPEGVKILPEQAALNMAPMAPRMQDMQATRMAPAAEAPNTVRRERRTGANAAEWNAARNGQLNGYNPYTGTMPVAAGAYASFGGYGM